MSLTPRPGVQIVAGVFKIQKAYFNLDGAGNYGQLGQIRHSGVETSATISAKSGLTAVLGGVWLRPGVQLGPGVVDPNGGIALGVIPLRRDAEDVNDATDLRLQPAGIVLPEPGRRLLLTLATDF